MHPLPSLPPLGLRHIALNVSDVDRSAAFYRDVLGLKIEWRPDADNVYLTSGSDNLAIHKLPAGARPGSVQNLHHIGFVVRRPEDVDEWAERVRRQGVPILKPPTTHRDGARSFYFQDPDGVTIQLLYHPPISGTSG